MKHLPDKPLLRILLVALTFIMVLALYIWWQRDYFLPQVPAKPLTLTVLMPDSITGHAALRQGMEQAAFDKNCEIHFVHPLQAGDTAEQTQLLERELSLRTDGIILYPLDAAAMARPIAEAAKVVPLLLLNVPRSEAADRPVVSGDYEALAAQLAERTGGQPSPLLLIYREPLQGNEAVLYDALTRRFAGTEVQELALAPDEQTAAGQIDSLRFSGDETVIVLDSPGLTLLGNHIAVRVAGSSRPRILGVSRDAANAARLEQGIFAALAVENEFSAGYLAVSNLADLVRKQPVNQYDDIAVALIDRDNLETAKSQHLLFPIVQ